MRGVPLIVVLTACSAPPTPISPAPVPPAPATSSTPETLWDRGTFVVIDKEFVLPDTEETFEIFRTDDGYRFAVRFKRPAPTGELSDGQVTLHTDRRFVPLQGTMTSTIHYKGRDEITRSTIAREPDGRLSTEVTASNGEKEANRSTGRNDWYIGGTITSFLVALCQADESFSAPIVYPDKITSLAPAKPLPIDGSTRAVTYRVLEYQQSRRKVIAACEDGKLAGEVARGTTIVRKGDVELARTLEKWFR